jgi:hypothetical protein
VFLSGQVKQTDQPYEYAGDDPVNQTDPSGLGVDYLFGNQSNEVFEFGGKVSSIRIDIQSNVFDWTDFSYGLCNGFPGGHTCSYGTIVQDANQGVSTISSLPPSGHTSAGNSFDYEVIAKEGDPPLNVSAAPQPLPSPEDWTDGNGPPEIRDPGTGPPPSPWSPPEWWPPSLLSYECSQAPTATLAGLGDAPAGKYQPPGFLQNAYLIRVQWNGPALWGPKLQTTTAA